MVYPLLASAAKTIASAGLFEGARRALPKAGKALKGVAGKIGNFIKRNPATSAKSGGIAAGIGIGGYTLSDLFDEIGIQDNQVRVFVTGTLILGAVAAVGQLFDINL